MSAIAIFDIGKTNKKLFVFNEHYQVLLERSIQFAEGVDEDGDSCEDIDALTQWITTSLKELLADSTLGITAVNFSAYGASFVHLDANGNKVTPLYNYLKAFPAPLQQSFYEQYGGETDFAIQTASPALGNLNSGMQLYLLKTRKPQLFDRIHHSLHLPQYLSFLVSKKLHADITSIGCHTAMWDFNNNRYHEWLSRENIITKLPALFPCDQVMNTNWQGHALLCGVGMHDSSAALIPYLEKFNEPFILISTGTWCISLNPFNHDPLTADELKQDCLCYLSYRGKPVKASRLFAGYEHEQAVKRLGQHFLTREDYYKQVPFNKAIGNAMLQSANAAQPKSFSILKQSGFAERKLGGFKNYEEAYHQLIADIIHAQVASTRLLMQNNGPVNIFVDGGFSRNPCYMNMLALGMPSHRVHAASVAQASALGAAIAVHQHWNTQKLPDRLIELKVYTDIETTQL